jgi:hypothetical protein
MRRGLRRHSLVAWKAVVQVPEVVYLKPKRDRQAEPLGRRATLGCLGMLFFGVIFWLLLPLLFFLAVEALVLAYALAMTVLWALAELCGAVFVHHPKQTAMGQPMAREAPFRPLP